MQNQSTVDLDCIYSVVQKSRAAPSFCRFCFQARFFCNFYFCLPNPSCQVAITKRADWGKRLKLYWIEQRWIANQWWIYILNFWFKFSSLHTEEEVSRGKQHRVYTTNMAEALAWYEAAFQLVVWSKLIELWMQQRSIRFDPLCSTMLKTSDWQWLHSPAWQRSQADCQSRKRLTG